MNADFTPIKNDYKDIGRFRFWCQKVLPLTYDDSLSYYELLCKMVNYLNDTITNVDMVGADMEKVYDAYNQLQNYVNTYYDNLDAQALVDVKLDTMAEDGTLSVLIRPMIVAYEEQLAVLNARMDEFTKLAEGSTTGDAELVDARVDYNGKTWANVGEHMRGVSNELSASVEQITGYTNELVFPAKVFSTEGVLAEAVEGTSLIHFKADNVMLSNQKVFNILADEPFVLKPDTEYTLSGSMVSGDFQYIGAMNLTLNRRDTYAALTMLNAPIFRGKQSVTFRTPADTDRYYFVATFAVSTNALNFDVNVNLNITEGNTPNYAEYDIDINKELCTVKKLLNRTYGVHNIVVAKDGTGEYETVTDAVANAKDFDVIYVKNGVYENELIKAWNKTVSIIGESRDGVVIKNNTGSYDTPPIEMGTGLLKNLTIYAENDGTYNPSNKGYAIHSESSVTNYNLFVIDNCTVKSDWRASWGMGMRGGVTYLARNCEFDGVYFHDCQHAHAVGEQNIYFDTCNIVKNSLIMQDQNMSGSSIDVRFVRCLVEKNVVYYLWDSANNNVITKRGFVDFPNWKLNNLSWSNSKSELNAI